MPSWSVPTGIFEKHTENHEKHRSIPESQQKVSLRSVVHMWPISRAFSLALLAAASQTVPYLIVFSLQVHLSGLLALTTRHCF